MSYQKALRPGPSRLTVAAAITSLLATGALPAPAAAAGRPGAHALAPPAACRDVTPGFQILLPGQETLDVYWDLAGPVAPAEAEVAIRDAIGVWNSALGGGLSLRFAGSLGTPPTNTTFVEIRFLSASGLFAGSGHEAAFVGKEICVEDNYAIAHMLLNEAVSFSVAGAVDDSYDLTLVLIHELGHVLGLDHYTTLDRTPPIMASRLPSNRELLAAGVWTMAELRNLFPEDIRLMQAVMARRGALDISGTYGGTLAVESVEAGSSIPVGREITIEDFIVRRVGAEIEIEWQGEKVRSDQRVRLLAGEPLAFPALADGRFLSHLQELTRRGDNGIGVKLRRVPLRQWVILEGVLTRH